MADHPAEYPWSSYRVNALGEANVLLRTHFLFDALGQAPTERQENYKGLFDSHIPIQAIKEIREMTN